MEPSFPLDPKVPVRHWTDLSDHDKRTYNELRVFFRQQQKEHLKERKTTPFASEILCILNYIEQDTPGRDDRCIVAGIGFAGPLICVNTQQLKNLVCRCKSSINSGFQQIGYDAIRTKSKAREAILAIIPELKKEPSCLRQWTVRAASDASYMCFLSWFRPPGLPEICAEDFYEERKATRLPPPQLSVEQPFRFQPPPFQVRQVDDVAFDDDEQAPVAQPKVEFDFVQFQNEDVAQPDLLTSLSVDFLSGFDNDFVYDFDAGGFGEPSWLNPNKTDPKSTAMPRSKSAVVQSGWGGLF